ncbi:hypothetical protein K503DRAFT_362282 [Rhizopogon vinicolor AM-OR11-026]|uniref:Large ribosomal subunit protein bL32m n=1 Tax=Rhizopogon vinicolor AM-OR11-026 TaxID=1314800 RepID=A0A1B7NC12_9AGAM|nr:hypothetical protein K503DRAFT_362282 [Rhizopogon vinicolor AM-OR11-026]
MASLALHQTRSFISTLRLSWARLPIATFLDANLELQQKPFRWTLPGLQSLLELLPPIVLAVPKSKISHSRKAMRSANKGLKDKRNIVNCPACGEPKLAHHACRTCYASIVSRFKLEAKKLATDTKKRVGGGSWSTRRAPLMIEGPKDS